MIVYSLSPLKGRTRPGRRLLLDPFVDADSFGDAAITDLSDIPGFAYLLNDAGAFLLNDAEAYLIVETE